MPIDDLFDDRPEDLWAPEISATERNYWLRKDEAEGKTRVPETPALDLRETYGITPAMTFRKKVHRLYMLYQLTPGEIAGLLRASEEDVTKECDAVDRGYLAKGSVLSPLEQTKERGRTISELEMAKAEADSKYHGTQDIKWFNASKDISMRILDLKGLDKDRGAGDGGDDFVSKFNAALDAMPAETLESLRNELGV